METHTVNRAERDAVALHVWFAVLATVVLAVPADVRIGWRVALLVAAYIIAVPALAVARKHREWIGMWAFALVLSLLQVVPDRFLAEVLGTLEFPADGVPDIGEITGYMAGLWVIPLFLVLLIGRGVDTRQGRGPAYVAVLLTSAVLFIGAEQLMPELPAWRPVGVETIGNVALYIVPAELLLGVATFHAFEQSRNRWVLVRVPVAVVVMLLYLGTAVTSWFTIERILA